MKLNPNLLAPAVNLLNRMPIHGGQTRKLSDLVKRQESMDRMIRRSWNFWKAAYQTKDPHRYRLLLTVREKLLRRRHQRNEFWRRIPIWSSRMMPSCSLPWTHKDTNLSAAQPKRPTGLDAAPNYVTALMVRARTSAEHRQSDAAVVAYSEILRRLPDSAPAQERARRNLSRKCGET